MEVTMRRDELLKLGEVLAGLKRVRSTRLAYAVARNVQGLKGEMESLEAARQAPEEFMKYEQERKKLIHMHSRKDEKGNPVSAGPSSVAIEDPIAFDAEMQELKEEYSEALKAIEIKNAEIMELLKEEVTLDIYAIKAEYLPSDLDYEEMLSLMPIVEGDIGEALDKMEEKE